MLQEVFLHRDCSLLTVAFICENRAVSLLPHTVHEAIKTIYDKINDLNQPFPNLMDLSYGSVFICQLANENAM